MSHASNQTVSLDGGSAIGTMRPKSRTYEMMPPTSTRPATMNAAAKECVAATMYPVATGATMPIILLKKFITPAIMPVPPRGAIKEGNDQATGAGATLRIQETELGNPLNCSKYIPIGIHNYRANRWLTLVHR